MGNSGDDRSGGGRDDREDRMNEQQAELLAFALSPRPERIVDAMAAADPALPAAIGHARELVSVLARAAQPVAPSAALKGRLLATFAARRARPRKAALLVVDMMNDHLRPGASLEVPRAREIVPALKERLAAARADGTPIVYIVDRHEDGDSDLDFVEGWGAHNQAGTDGAEVWPAIAPEPTDIVVPKATYNAFTGSKLDAVLDDLGVDSLILTGCLTEIGIMATATAALERGFAVDVPAPLQAGSHADLEKAALMALAGMAPYGPARQRRLARLAEARA